MSVTVFSLILAVATLVLVLELLRRRKLREKYALIWVLVSVAGVVVALIPALVGGAASLLGVQVPSNLLFVVSLVVLLVISLQLSGEVGQLEEQSRILAEDVARLALQVRRLEQGRTGPGQGSDGRRVPTTWQVPASEQPQDQLPVGHDHDVDQTRRPR